MDDLTEQFEELSQIARRVAENPPPPAEGLPGEERPSSRGHFLEIRQPVEAYARDFRTLRERGPAILELGRGHWTADQPLDRQLLSLCSALDGAPLFFDIETCGFSGSSLFLIGSIEKDEQGSWVLIQRFARGYHEEAAIVASFAESLKDETVLVSFNGKSFDWPFVQDRIVRHRLPVAGTVPHHDLLHLSRRRWPTQFPNHKLQTLETYLCGRRRVHDLGGRDVAVAYHEFVRSGLVRDVRRILQHNALDVLTLVQLAYVLVDPTDPIRPQQAPQSLWQL